MIADERRVILGDQSRFGRTRAVRVEARVRRAEARRVLLLLAVLLQLMPFKIIICATAIRMVFNALVPRSRSDCILGQSVVNERRGGGWCSIAAHALHTGTL